MNTVKRMLKGINHVLSELYVSNFQFEPYIQTVLIHKLYPTRKEIVAENGAISEGIDVAQFERFIKFFVKRNIRFIDESEIIANELDPKGQYMYLTFDDGYFNNFLALEVLEKYNAKATFYISTNHVIEQKAFWWDVLFRELSSAGKLDQMSENIQVIYKLKWWEQEAKLKEMFGHGALNPRNDLDRPMNIDELGKFAKYKCVTLGNHTDNHLNVTLYSNEELRESLENAHKFLNEYSDKRLASIAYPYGFYNERCVDIVKEIGYEVGITVEPGKNYVDDLKVRDNRMRMKRNEFSGFIDIESQCRNMHVNFSLARRIKKVL